MAAKPVTYTASEYLSPKVLCTVVTVFLAMFLLQSVASLVSSILQWELLNRMATGGAWTEAEAQANDVREALIGGVEVLIYLATSIPFLKLLGRFTHNAWWFGAAGMKYTPGWTVGSFFVPFANLIWPVQAVQESYRVSQPGTDDWTKRPNSGLVGLWWGCWLLTNVLGQISTRMVMAQDVSTLQTATLVEIITEASAIALACVALLMLRALTAQQEAKFASGERYVQAQVICPMCGEPTGAGLKKCQMCGAEVPLAV